MADIASFDIAGIEGLCVESHGPERAVMALLHGHAMEPEDLASLARAMGLAATLYLPRGTQAAVPQGRGWWPVDAERRAAQLRQGARDLFDEYPPGREALRAHFAGWFAELALRHAGRPLLLAGFSQGGMLATDLVLNAVVRPRALALLSTSCIAFAEWQPRVGLVRGLPVLVAHGRHDEDLSIGAGERLRDLLGGAGAQVSWLPFDGGHNIPMIVWRELRRFARRAVDDGGPPGPGPGAR